MAQPVTLTKEVCDATTGVCGANSVNLGQTLYYQITIDNIGGVPHPQINVQDTLPSGFIVTGAECGPVGGPMHVVTPIIALPLVTLPNEPLGPVKLVCRIKGSFGAGSSSNVGDLVDVLDHTVSIAAAPQPLNHIVNLTAPLPSDLSLSKTADKTSLDISPGSNLPHYVTYKIRLKNLGANDLYLGSLLEIQDRLSLNLNGVALNVKLISATCAVVVGTGNGGLSPPSDCLDTAPVQSHSITPLLVGYSAPHDFAAWRYPTSGPGSAGLLRVGDEVVLTVVVEVSAVANLHCVVAPGGDGFDQEAHIVLTLPGVGGGPITTLADLQPLNNTATVPLQVITGETVVDPNCNAGYKPKLAIKKVQLLPPASSLVGWHPSATSGPPVVYQITVTNVSSGTNAATIRNINLADLIEEMVGTPPFTATVASSNCANPDCVPSGLPSSQQLPGYGLFSTTPIFTATLFGGVNSLGAGNSFSFNIFVRYSDQRCDSLRDGHADPIRNHAQISSWEETDNASQVTTTVTLAIPLDSYAQTNMVEAPACPLIVGKKAITSGPIVFNTPHTYVVGYANPTTNPTPYVVGTLIDTLSIAPPNPTTDPPYAVTLKVDYNYACTPIGPINGYPTGQTGIAYIVANALPQQGVRLIQNSGPVSFGPLSSLACTVTVTVHPPAANDPFCWTGELVNSAILDMSAYYNPNLPWTGTMNMAKSVSTPLPRCYSWSVNKRVPPGWTWLGGPLNWTWSVYNAGPPIPSTGAPVIEDKFTAAPHAPAGLGVNNTALTCVDLLPSPACAGSWSPPPATTPSLATAVLKPSALAYKQEMDMLLAVNAVPSALVHGDAVCNSVSVTPQPIPGPNAYWKSTATLASNACAKILDTASIAVTKVVLNHSGIPISPTTAFAVTVSCFYPPDSNAVVIPAASLTLTAGATGTVAHIPVQSECSVSDSPQVPPPTPNCAFPAWQVYTTPLSPFTIPTSSANGIVNVTLVNDLICKPVGSIVIKKTTSFLPGVPPPFSSVAFTVNCNPLGPHTTVSVPANGQILVPNVPLVSTCSIAEVIPASNIPGCTWSASPNPIPPVTVNVANSTTLVKVTNKLVCTGKIVVRKKTSVPPGVLLPASIAFNVSCSPGGPFTVTAPANGSSPPTTVPAPSACTVAEQIPLAIPGCVWNVVQSPPGNVLIVPGATVIVDVANSLTCKPGHLVITKGTKALAGVPVPASFTFNVNCAPGGPNQAVTVPANGASATLAVPTPANCTVGEVVPAPPPGCSWGTSQSPTGNIAVAPGATIVVSATNKLVCKGTLIIRKSTIFPPGVPQFASVQVQVNCAPGGPNTLVTLPANGQVTLPNVVAPGTCTIAEQLPPPPLPGCAWTVGQAPPGNVPVGPGASVLVTLTNSLVCKPGRIIINKVTIHPVAQPPFTFLVNCTPGGPANLPVTVPSNGSATVNNIVTPAQCTIVEQPHAAPAGCSWVGSQAPPGALAVGPGATITVTFTNKLVCTGTLQIFKQTVSPVFQPPFTFIVNCTPGGPTNLPVTVPAAGIVPVPNIPAPAVCTLAEQPHAAPTGCTWVATQLTPGPINIAAGATVTVAYINKLVCNPLGTLIINKVTIPSPVATLFPSIPIDVDCNPGGPHSSLTLPANGQVSVGNIPAASSCAVTEHLPTLNANCAWVGTPSPSNPVTVPAGATVTMTITNKVVCTPPGTLIIKKTTSLPPPMGMTGSIGFNVNCTPGGPNTTVGAPINGQSNGLAVPAGATCSVTEAVPTPPAGCAWNVSQVPPGNVAVASGATVTVSVTNKLVCTPAASLVIKKIVVVPPGSPPGLPGSYPFSVSCPGGFSASVAVPPNGQSTVSVPAPVTCTVTEQPPPPLAFCSWTTNQSPPGGAVTTIAGGTVTVTATNTLICQPPTGGELVVVKKTIVPPGMAMPASFSFVVNCGGANMVVTGPANGSSPAVATPPPPAQCTVAEQAPPAPGGCSWNINPPMPVTVAALSGGTATVNVVNRLDCPTTGNGTLVVRKFVMVNGSHVPVSPSTLPAAWATGFPVTVTCGSNAPVPGSLNAGNNYQGTAAMTVGTACTVQETTPPFPTANCHWATTYPQGQSATMPTVGATATIDIYNEQVCP